jgi:hypothetical protein
MTYLLHGTRPAVKRVCFLFNHDQTHQIGHSLPIALAMVESGEIEVVLAYSSPAIGAELLRLAGPFASRAQIVQLRLKSPVSRLLAASLERLAPASKALLYRDNLDFFRSFDAIVVSEKTSLLLKTRYRLDKVKLIHTRHGAGDRAIGFNRQSRQFDLVLVSGPKIRDRLIADAGLSPGQIAICGYPKFDLCERNRFVGAFADPELPLVLYNPHPSPRLSSWGPHGHAVLEAFVEQDRYNLVFAPHVMLFERRWTITLDPPAVAKVKMPSSRVLSSPRIHVDLGSPASSDMSYTNAADLYLGDVSSQVYEFLRQPRPCLFLNSHGVTWQNDRNYLHWQAGPVIGSPDGLLDAIDHAFASHPHYETRQRELLAETFSVSERPSAIRAAAAIGDFLSASAGN